MGKVNSSVDNLRYELFAKKSETSEKLPPTMDAFDHHLCRANLQAYIWTHSKDQYLDICPINNRWKVDESGHLIPVLMELPPSSDVVLDFRQCDCSGNCSSKQCKCRKEDLVCSDACKCDSEECSNRELYTSDTESDED